uniref:Reverse transcriptase domain-containing protein n=1 Tax=Oryza sativa subsp. japonica TaxID=39947 RepID=Q75GM5_ORYSJ|nr:hypothetical protein [Oryza sativa Japonica Group]
MIFQEDEIYWQERSGEKRLLEGDANTAFFHGVANGKKRKSTIRSLEEDGRVIEEIERALAKMKTNTAPGPDGLPVCFYKEFWEQLKDQIKEMLDSLFEGRLDLWRHNYGVITSIPKIKEANNIKAFRPICLLNVCFKLLTKVLTLRLTHVANKVIGESQTAFLPGRFILDGVVILHEVLHELKNSGQSSIVLKLDFKKAYDKAKDAGHLLGLVPHLVPGGLTHLQYADDTILFMTNSEENIVTVKFLLYCYEAMGALPITYLGLPISEGRLTAKDLEIPVTKIEKRLEGKKKYHLIKWEALCRPKEDGGLGFINTKIMNEALLCEWIYKLESGNNSPCCNLLRKKYLGQGGGFFQSSPEGGSQFWKSLHEVKNWMKLGSAYNIGNGGGCQVLG